MTPALLRPSQLAALLGVDARTIRRWVEIGCLPPRAVIRTGESKTHKRIRISAALLIQAGWLNADAVAVTP